MEKVLTLAIVALLPILGMAQAPADDPASVPRMSKAEFKKLLDAGALTVIDVRDAESYRNGHIPGARSVPFAALAEHLAELKASKKPIVAYCA